MNEDPVIYDLKHVEEHTSCMNYRLNLTSGFRYLPVKTGYILKTESVTKNYIVILLGGTYSFDCNQFRNKPFSGGQMVCVPKNADFKGHVLSDGEAIIFGFDQPESSCDKQIFSQYTSFYSDERYAMAPTPIRYPMDEFLHLLSYYLRNRMNCMHLHAMKHKEFFLILRAFYTDEEIAGLLWPVLSNMSEFKYFVKTNFNKVNSINELISISPYSRAVFFRKFKAEFGEMSPQQWITEHRRGEILEVAAIPNITVKEMMHQLNMTSMTTLQRTCETLFGQSALELIGSISVKARKTT